MGQFKNIILDIFNFCRIFECILRILYFNIFEVISTINLQLKRKFIQNFVLVWWKIYLWSVHFVRIYFENYSFSKAAVILELGHFPNPLKSFLLQATFPLTNWVFHYRLYCLSSSAIIKQNVLSTCSFLAFYIVPTWKFCRTISDTCHTDECINCLVCKFFIFLPHSFQRFQRIFQNVMRSSLFHSFFWNWKMWKKNFAIMATDPLESSRNFIFVVILTFFEWLRGIWNLYYYMTWGLDWKKKIKSRKKRKKKKMEGN